MDLSAYLLNQVVDATTPPNETAAAARSRADAIVEMVCAFDPRDGMEAMIACHCVMLQFLLTASMRDANDTNLEPAVLARARAGAVTISRTLHQWTTKFEKTRKSNESRAAETVRTLDAPIPATEPAAARSPAPAPLGAQVTPPRQSVSSIAARHAIDPPVSNGKAGAAAILPDTSLPAADNAPLIASGQSMSDRRHHVPPLSL